MKLIDSNAMAIYDETWIFFWFYVVLNFKLTSQSPQSESQISSIIQSPNQKFMGSTCPRRMQVW